jgi:hypothetical protein
VEVLVTGHDGKLICLQPRSSTKVTSGRNYNFTGERQKSVRAIKFSPDSVFYLLVRSGLQTAQPSMRRSFHRPVRVEAAWRQFTTTGEIYEASSSSRASSELFHLLSILSVTFPWRFVTHTHLEHLPCFRHNFRQ